MFQEYLRRDKERKHTMGTSGASLNRELLEDSQNHPQRKRESTSLLKMKIVDNTT
jgi:hypothetical protein